MSDLRPGVRVLIMNTLAFAVCFAVWMMNGVLVTYLVESKVFAWDKAQMGWLIGIPVLTGALFRLPAGVLTDRFGGRPVFAAIMLVSAGACYLGSYANTYWQFMLAGLGFGLAGSTFAVGIAYTSVWFPRRLQGTALGIFGVGNAGAAITSLCAPALLRAATDGGANLDGWRTLPRIYALALGVTTILFWLLTVNRVCEHGAARTLRQSLAPIKSVRVWRFGLYYFLVFGGFVALAQWLIPYYVNVYAVSVATAGLLASIFSLPSGVIRALGGVLSDRLSARTVMYWVLGGCALCCLALVVPRMEIFAPGQGLMASAGGTVEAVNEGSIVVGETTYPLVQRPAVVAYDDNETYVLPTGSFWQEPLVAVGDTVHRKQLIARGMTHVYFQANIWIFTALVFVIGILMGIGKAAVYKYIPEYFPENVGVVGGVVGVLGGLGGFFCPILFGYMLRGTGIWTTAWMFLFALSAVCLIWLHLVMRRVVTRQAPELAQQLDTHPRDRRPDRVAAESNG